MGKILYFDCFSGISGDMTLGALLDLGVDLTHVKAELDKLELDGFQITAEKTQRRGISGTDVDVILNGKKEDDISRNLEIIENLVMESGVSQRAKELSLAMFQELAAAEARVHGVPITKVHFHEVGAIDSIVDTVATAICIDMLEREFDVEEIRCSSLSEGQGSVSCSHGELPIPVPAVLEMLKGSSFEISTTQIKGELITPTGLSILKTVAKPCTNMPNMTVEKTGYGFGKRDTGKLNALRVILGELKTNKESLFESDTVILMETNLDNTTGEMLGFVMEKLFQNEALDVFYSQIQMKKNRPAVKLSVICHRHHIEKIAEIIMEQTGTIGIRYYETPRFLLKRKYETLETKYGMINVKIAFSLDGSIKKYAPEYEECKILAEKVGVPLMEIYKEVDKQILI